MKVNLGCGRIVRPSVREHGQVPARERGLHLGQSRVGTRRVLGTHDPRGAPDLRVGGVLEVRVPYGIKSLFNPFHLRAFDRTSFDLFAKMDLGYQSQAWFRFDTRVVRGLPKEWHLRRYMPRIF